jgi:hypothetical protein
MSRSKRMVQLALQKMPRRDQKVLLDEGQRDYATVKRKRKPSLKALESAEGFQCKVKRRLEFHQPIEHADPTDVMWRQLHLSTCLEMCRQSVRPSSPRKPSMWRRLQQLRIATRWNLVSGSYIYIFINFNIYLCFITNYNWLNYGTD